MIVKCVPVFPQYSIEVPARFRGPENIQEASNTPLNFHVIVAPRTLVNVSELLCSSKLAVTAGDELRSASFQVPGRTISRWRSNLPDACGEVGSVGGGASAMCHSSWDGLGGKPRAYGLSPRLAGLTGL